mmetsp:Transcript_19954/g.54375  ORF Transcript_19954/g.54375 Transcript_19954/m.54375 type:complete len:296 (+) Transcript_19954:122-1009(+)
MSSMFSGLSFASLSTVFTVSKVRLKMTALRVSNLALATSTLYSSPPMESSTLAVCPPERSRLARSAAAFSLERSRASFSSSWCLPLNSVTSQSTSVLSKSSPPRRVSPPVARTVKTPPSRLSTVASKVPPPRSKMRMFEPLSLSAFWSRPYASAAAVGSLMMRRTWRPAMAPASFVAWRCESLKYAGTVTTALEMGRPRLFSAICFIRPRIIALISSGANRWVCPDLVSISTSGFFSSPSTMGNGKRFPSLITASSLIRWPMMRFTSKAVDLMCFAAMLFAAWPMSRSPAGVQPT